MEEDHNTPRSGRYPARGDADFPAEHHTHDDEISLYDLWDVLMRRLPVLIGVALLVIVVGAVYAFSQPIEYTYRSQIELAQLPEYHNPASDAGGGNGEAVPVVPVDSVQRELEQVLIPEVRGRLAGDNDAMSRLQVSVSGTNPTVSLTSTAGPDASDSVTQLHQAIIEAFQAQQEAALESAVQTGARPFEERAELLGEQITELEAETERLAQASARGDGVRAMVFAQQLGDVRRELRQARLQRLDAQSMLETIWESAEPMDALGVARKSSSPVGPSRSLIIALSVVLAGMLGLFAAFFWEFVSNARRYRRTQSEQQLGSRPP
ncbi:Wzz/FepE/Etk N-terminal domain-containing protein [Aquisalimonas lutea]|uniref:Wzz/FepE/Etk N-terminal domain-containing protein n=1 Tax=Aquisalimonas lutea TaxID=1327750 RepID=UPI0025B4EB8E|nr:Wzz/FepE/Etk N-terminal domain-containing protein [Aquisalimonas lutea]MDN3517815.1 Wzz/FepE/Etk N-terminal domain-containing protein [Aquisalimonas lutea]